MCVQQCFFRSAWPSILHVALFIQQRTPRCCHSLCPDPLLSMQPVRSSLVRKSRVQSQPLTVGASSSSTPPHVPCRPPSLCHRRSSSPAPPTPPTHPPSHVPGPQVPQPLHHSKSTCNHKPRIQTCQAWFAVKAATRMAATTRSPGALLIAPSSSVRPLASRHLQPPGHLQASRALPL
jgi:hypothetical protein